MPTSHGHCEFQAFLDPEDTHLISLYLAQIPSTRLDELHLPAQGSERFIRAFYDCDRGQLQCT